MKRVLVFLSLIMALTFFAETTFAQGTVTQSKVGEFNLMIWTVAAADFDSLDAIWSPPFSLSYGAATFDAQGIAKFGAVTGGATVSTELLLYGSTDGTNWLIADSLGTVSNSNAAKLSVDLDDWDQTPYYKVKATNGGAANSFVLSLFRE